MSELNQLRETVNRLRAALEPFAAIDTGGAMGDDYRWNAPIKLGMLRRAREEYQASAAVAVTEDDGEADGAGYGSPDMGEPVA